MSSDRTVVATFVDLFSGAGGLSLGLKRRGWRSLLAVDAWADAIRTYDHNFHPAWLASHGQHSLIERGRKTLVADLSTDSAKREVVSILGQERPEWVVGGPPCKGFSTIGKRDRRDPRNKLVDDFADIVASVRPFGFLVENVLGLKDMNFVERIVSSFASLGYTVTPVVLKAAEYGVPQLRHRIIFVGHSAGLAFKKPSPTHSVFATVWEAISDLPPLQPGMSSARYRCKPTNEFQEQLRGGSSYLQGHAASKHPAALVEAISYIPDGGNRSSIPSRLQPKSGFHNSYSRLHSASPAVAVTQNMGKPSGTRCIHPFQNRGLTAREGARLQTFPDWFHFQGGSVSQREQIANAVPPMMAEVIAKALVSDNSWTGDTAEAARWNESSTTGVADE